ncbi:hypothetical protein FH039_06810 [Thermococcus indicus]|uniref:Uncharacterized protein n=1 Tax=Thermococcus indicus TaxID=2586643 RepID=A0A4Y5SKD6_9EURY|nr:hypothetical protein [Thermococcus indicus]QDA31368.1 hypothetical protein FH039_06810 [Thermococcus indicus]
MPPLPPPIRGRPDAWKELAPETAEKAIETVKNALPFFTAGTPIVHRAPHGTHVDVPVMYLSFAIDRLHYNPETGNPLPKGLPGAYSGEIDPAAVKEKAGEILKELRVLDAAEFREPENCWVVPVAWKSFIILHVRVSVDGRELVPDYGLTEEVRRHGI